MKQKQKPDEYRMKASEFDKMMRRALAAPSDPKPKAARKKVTKKQAPKK